MDQKKQNNLPDEDNWFDSLLHKPEVGQEIGPDEHAVSSAGLSELSDIELEKILAEAKSADWGAEEAPVEEQLPPPPKKAPPAGDFKDDDYREIFGEGEELEEIFSTAKLPTQPVCEEESYEEEEEEAPEFFDQEVFAEVFGKPLPKGRPKKKGGYGLLGIPHILTTVLWLAMIVAIGVTLGRFIWVCASDILAFGKEQKTITVTIDADDDLEDVSYKLYNAGIIRYPGLFEIYGNIVDAMDSIKPGKYELNTLYDYMALKNAMSYHKRGDIKTIVIPEGWTMKQIFEHLEEKNICTVAELEAYAISGQLDNYWFLEGADRSTPGYLEGYLFPDTYEFYEKDTPYRVLDKLLDNFEIKFTERMHQKLEVLNETLAAKLKKQGFGQDYINEHKMTVHDIVIVASMVEKETAGGTEGYRIASVIYNRLTNPGEYPFLNIDATIVYALGGKTELTKEDLQIDHPYNTYKYKGLPPGPISNPGLSSLDAALEPDVEPYHYYALDKTTRKHVFFKTYKEMQDWLGKQGN